MERSAVQAPPGDLVALGLALLLCAACAAAIYLPREEDAFIYYRFALNWARGRGLVFNAGERVEGYSSPIWMLIVGLVARLGWALPLAVPALGIGFGAATVGATYRLARRVGLDRFGCLASAAGVALSYPFLYWSRSGLETPFYSLLLVLTANLYLAAEYPPPADPARHSRLQLAGGAALALVSLARPEGLLMIPLVAADRLADRRDWRGAARYILPAAAGYGAFLLWRLGTYGSLLPNTSVKLYPLLAGRAARQLLGYCLMLGALPPLLPALALLSRRLRRVERRRLTFLIAVVGTLSVLFHLVAGGEYRSEFRYLVPTLPILLVAIWWSAEHLELESWSARRPFASMPGRLFLLVLLQAGSLTLVGADLPAAGEWQQLRRQWTELLDEREDWRVATCLWLAERVPNGGVVALGQMGRIPYCLAAAGRDVTFVDTLGLVDRQVSEIYRLDHKLAALARQLMGGSSLAQALAQGRREREARFAAHVLSRHPDFILVEIALAGARRMQALVQDPRFTACYREVADLPDDAPVARVYALQRALPCRPRT
jgi:arabinofuranosyltransferase